MTNALTVSPNTKKKQGSAMTPKSTWYASTARHAAAALSLTFAVGMALTPITAKAATSVQIGGEISRITLTTPGDYWSAGTMVISGQYVTIPRNLLIDLPANRLTLWQLFEQAPEACKALGETGLTSTDRCNTSGTGAYANISANRTNGGNIIAGDMLIEKGQEVVTGVVTYINHDEGYLRINGVLGDPNTGMLARMNDPTRRHTWQQGLGCLADSLNCSPDPRFTNDPDNYTNIAVTGYPMCIPSRVARLFKEGLPAQGNGLTDPNFSPAVPEQMAQSSTLDPARGDVLCPDTNRPVTPSGLVNDSRFMAPIRLGDDIKLEGNFETVNGVRFLSFHSSVTEIALETKPALSQPDYLAPDEVEQDAPGYENLRARTLLIGFSTRRPDVLLWTLHYDPVTNRRVEKPWASVLACDLIGGAGNCSANGLIPGVGGHIWKIRYNVDFATGSSEVTDNPCSNLRAEPRFGTGFCPVNLSTPAGSIAEQLAIVSPMPREIIARTGHRLAALAAGITPTTVDIKGAAATNGEYLVPLGVNLGGVGFPEFNEFDLTKMAWPFQFTGLPWTLDRRLSPGGCKDGVCESAPQPLDPYPFEGVDPRLQARNLPAGNYNDPRFTAAPLTDARNRILSYVTPVGDNISDFNGNASVLAWPPIDPPTFAVAVTPAETFCASSTGSCTTTVAPPVCAAPLVLRNGACMPAELLAPAPAPVNPPVVPVVTPVIAPPPPPVVTPVVTADTVTIEGVTWTQLGGRRGLMVVAKTSSPAGPVPSLFVSAFNSVNTVLPQTQMTRVTVPINLLQEANGAGERPVVIGTVQCSQISPCWQLPVTRLPGDADRVKPTSVVVQSSKGGSATRLATNGPGF